jgi:hypothetical protein
MAKAIDGVSSTLDEAAKLLRTAAETRRQFCRERGIGAFGRYARPR